MKDFMEMSRYAGMREDLVQAGGGNSSWKLSLDKMVIKASGYQLAEITEEEGYTVVNPEMIRKAFLEVEDLGKMTGAESKKILQEALIEGKRPSIETFLHAISGIYTLHTHPIVVNALACRKGGMELLGDLFPDALLVPYATPGVELAKAYFKTYQKQKSKKNQTFDIVFLQNHGLIVSADTSSEVIQKTEQITKIIEGELHCDFGEYHRLTDLWSFFSQRIIWRVTDVHVLEAYRHFGEMWHHAFSPDCVVFLGKKMLDLPRHFSQKDIEEFYTAFGTPVVVRYCEHIYIMADSVKKALEVQSVLSFSAQVMILNEGKECDFLSNSEQDFLLNWDAEKYRKNMK